MGGRDLTVSHFPTESGNSLFRSKEQKFKCLHIYFEGEGQKEREREGGRESQAGSLLGVEPNTGLDPTTLGS